MIPHYAPSLGMASALCGLLSAKARPTAADVEAAFAELLGVRCAILLPSVRAGILLALRAADAQNKVAVGPAYTCGVVHEAMRMSGAAVQLLDVEDGRYLVGCDSVLAATRPGACLVLSEVYGIAYRDDFLIATARLSPAVRILDMAMGLPDRRRLQRMPATDVALFSFGMGKCMFAGCGGVACLQDRELGERIRRLQERQIEENSIGQACLAAAVFLLRILSRTRGFYRLARTVAVARRSLRKRRSTKAVPDNPVPSDGAATGAGPEWVRAMPSWSRKITMYNLRRAEDSTELRRIQARAYYDALKSSGVVVGIDGDSLPQSHFPIRVPGTAVDRLRRRLWRRGIDASKEFMFLTAAGDPQFPNANKASRELLTLPLGERLSLRDVKRIAGQVLEGLDRAGLAK